MIAKLCSVHPSVRASLIKGGTTGLLVVLLGGCQALPDADATLYPTLNADETYARLVESSRYGIAPDQDVLALSPEARALADDIARNNSADIQRFHVLTHLFTVSGGLELEYRPLGIYSAAETLERRAGNRLAFAHLFIALARELGLDAHYREVFGLSRWDEVGEYVLVNWHVGAYGEIPPHGTFNADFGLLDFGEDRFGGVIGDARARAQHFNNLGARALTQNDPAAAVRYFNRALVIDRALSYVWSNLGTAYARLDEPELSELAYRQALRVDVYDTTAVNQLASLYDRLDAQELADAYRDRAARLSQHNPYRQFHEGRAAIEAGNLNQAVGLLRQATRTQPGEFHFHLQYGRALTLQGHDERARSQFARAAEVATTAEQQQALLETMVRLTADIQRRRELTRTIEAAGSARCIFGIPPVCL